jgi:hypothetical protein
MLARYSQHARSLPFCMSMTAQILAMDALQIRSVWRASVPFRTPETVGHATIRTAI